MTQQCCHHCKAWGEESSMYRTTIKRYKRNDAAWFCNQEHAIRWKKIHQPAPKTSLKKHSFTLKVY